MRFKNNFGGERKKIKKLFFMIKKSIWDIFAKVSTLHLTKKLVKNSKKIKIIII